jgi:NAD+ synthase
LESGSSSFKKNPFYPPVSPELIKLLVSFLKEEANKCGFKKCVIGLSGGLDSSVTAALSVKAYGKKNVFGLILPYKTNSKDSISDALNLSESLGIHSEISDITSSVDALASTSDKINKIRLGNIAARMRMIKLYDYSAMMNGLVIGTGNKTEILLGYSTIFGDAAYAINPIGDLYKTQVRQLSVLLKIPVQIITKKPSADLWPGQSDESDLGFSYKEVDRLLYYLVDRKYSVNELIEIGFTKKLINKVRDKIRMNQFKRLPPVIAKISDRTVNCDFRYNRDWGF